MNGTFFIFLVIGVVGLLFLVRNANKDHWE